MYILLYNCIYYLLYNNVHIIYFLFSFKIYLEKHICLFILIKIMQIVCFIYKLLYKCYFKYFI